MLSFKPMHQKLTIEEMQRLDRESFKRSEKLPLILVLDNIRSVHNVGSVLRTADGFRLAGVWLCGITATPPSPEIHKTALGAENTVEWRYFADTIDAIKELKTQQYTIAAIEQCQNSVMLNEWQVEDKQSYAFILGNEVRGVQQEVIDAADLVIEIPQFGTKHSLNVSVTAGIVMWEASRQLRQK